MMIYDVDCRCIFGYYLVIYNVIYAYWQKRVYIYMYMYMYIHRRKILDGYLKIFIASVPIVLHCLGYT